MSAPSNGLARPPKRDPGRAGSGSAHRAQAEHRLLAVALPELPEVHPGDDLGRLAAEAWWSLAVSEPELSPRAGDVLVVTQKVVSKAEGRIVRLADVRPRPEAVAFARAWGKDARQVEVVLRESSAILRMERGVIIRRTRGGSG